MWGQIRHRAGALQPHSFLAWVVVQATALATLVEVEDHVASSRPLQSITISHLGHVWQLCTKVDRRRE